MSFNQKLHNVLNRDQGSGAASSALGRAGMMLLHLAKALFVLYSAAHGISASISYANTNWQALFQVGGIVALEVTLVGLYLGFLNHKIKGGAHLITAAITYAVGFVLAALGIIVDSQLNAGMAISSVLSAYLHWGLPLAPMLMAVGGFGVHMSDPETLRRRREAEQENKIEQERFDQKINEQQLALDESKTRAGVRLFGRQAVVETYVQWLDSPEFAEMVRANAAATLPALMAEAGLRMPGAAAAPRIEPVVFDGGDVPDAMIDNISDRLSADPSPAERRDEIRSASARFDEVLVDDETGNGLSNRPTLRGPAPK